MMFHPLVQEIDYCQPIDALGCFSLRPGLAFLDSAMAHPTLGRWSWLAPDPFARFCSRGGTAYWNEEAISGHPAHALRDRLSHYRGSPGDPRIPLQPGATGVFDYEAGRLFERLPVPKNGSELRPEIDLWFHDVGIAFDQEERRAYIISTGWPEDDSPRRGRRLHDRAEWIRAQLATRPPAPPNAPSTIEQNAWQANMRPDDYQENVETTQRFIRDGDIFQANITQAWRAEIPQNFDPLTLYRQLRSANPATFAALLVTPDGLVASSSPEGFLSLRDGLVETRPIKGTRPRSDDAAKDSQLAADLLHNEKERAENVMIVDLMRNDLSRVCLPGSVDVPVLCGLESYASVHHLASVVRGRLKPELDALHLMAACFPGGSITGAPKIRAMEIIHALEPEPRGVYCGSVVHFGYDGSLASNIAIRTLAVAGHSASIRAGGGITLLSDPREEYAESLLKAERLFQAFEPARFEQRRS